MCSSTLMPGPSIGLPPSAFVRGSRDLQEQQEPQYTEQSQASSAARNKRRDKGKAKAKGISNEDSQPPRKKQKNRARGQNQEQQQESQFSECIQSLEEPSEGSSLAPDSYMPAPSNFRMPPPLHLPLLPSPPTFPNYSFPLLARNLLPSPNRSWRVDFADAIEENWHWQNQAVRQQLENHEAEVQQQVHTLEQHLVEHVDDVQQHAHTLQKRIDEQNVQIAELCKRLENSEANRAQRKAKSNLIMKPLNELEEDEQIACSKAQVSTHIF